MKRVMVDMSATLVHHGHVRLINKAREYGEIIIGLTSDEEIKLKKGYEPELNFSERKEILESLEGVIEVVETPWLITESVLNQHRIDLLVHGDDNSNTIGKDRILTFPRTEGISSSELRDRALKSLVSASNRKLMLTPGPGALLYENLSGIEPVFGRGDEAYQQIETRVIDWLKTLSGKKNVAPLQGSATLALELGIKSMVNGRIALIDTGYYSDRMSTFINERQALTRLTESELPGLKGQYDWIVCCYTETSRAHKVDLEQVRKKADELGAKIFLDATASIGLEPDHHLANAMGFSSCKGLFGLTGAAFLAYDDDIEITSPYDSYYFNIDTHVQHGVTGPYHALCSLINVIDRHDEFVGRVRASKNKALELWPELMPQTLNQPLLCTYLEAQVTSDDRDNVILYQPRGDSPGSIICHIGEINSPELTFHKRIQISPL